MDITITNNDIYCETENNLIEKLINEKKLTEACDRISTLIAAIANSNNFVGKALTSKSYDDKIIEIAKLIAENDENINTNINDCEKNKICIIVTELYKTGGHTEIAKLIKDIFPSAIVIATNYFGKFRDIEKPVNLIKGMPDLALPACSALEKIQTLTKFLRNFNGRTILISHHHDVVALISAINSTQKPIFIFHSDHRVSLGHTMENFTHVALVPETKKNALKYEGFYTACQSVRDYGSKKLNDINSLKTCTIGGGEKFYWEGDLTLPKIISNSILNNLSIQHYHIGPLNPEQLNSIRHELQILGIDFSRFIHIQSVNSLWNYILNSEINMVIGSAPIHGTRSSIEIMGAGVPYLPFSGNIGHADMDQFFYPDYIEKWASLDELTRKINKIKSNAQQYSQSMRSHYESNFSFIYAQQDFEHLISIDTNLYNSPKLFNPN